MTPARTARSAWTMLLVLTAGFALSQAYRTVAAIMAPPLQAQFQLTAQQLGLFAGAFHFAFGAMQLFMGLGIDLHGLRRTVLATSPLSVLGALLSAGATSFPMLLLGQVLIGVGCAPAFLVCTVFVARHFPPERFTAISGMLMGLGGLGMLFTGTPLAWLIEAGSWRNGFWVLGAGSLVAWVLIWWLVHEPQAAAPTGAREPLGLAVRQMGRLLAMRHTLGIMAIAAVAYASFVALRGLWLGPMLVERHGYSLVASGNVALVMSVVSLVSAPLFGRLDPGDDTRRRRWLIGFTLATAALFACMAMVRTSALLDVTLTLVLGALSGYMLLQYAVVKAAYPSAMTGRALALFTMAMFLGIALMQWITGAVASAVAVHGGNAISAALLVIAALLGAGALAFAWLPQAPAAGEAATRSS